MNNYLFDELFIIKFESNKKHSKNILILQKLSIILLFAFFHLFATKNSHCELTDFNLK